MLVGVDVYNDDDSSSFFIEVEEREGFLLRDFVKSGQVDPSIDAELLDSRYPTIEHLTLAELDRRERDWLVGALLLKRFRRLSPEFTVSFSLK